MMWQQEQADKLKEEIEALLVPLSVSADLYALVKEPLTNAGRVLAPLDNYQRPWPLLALIAHEAISGSYEPALPVAAAHQLLIAAADVLDDVEDADAAGSSSAKYGVAIATNVATTLIILAEKSITQLKKRGVDNATIVNMIDTLNTFCMTACAGQHLELSTGSELRISEDTYLKISEMKSASPVECACHLGALLASAGRVLINKFSLFGRNLGMACQLTNDIQGITQGTDILKRKITLPVIYALAHGDDAAHRQLASAFSQQSESVANPVQIKDFLFSSGAIQYAMLKMEFYKQQALDSLSEIEQAGVSTGRLKLFLE